MEGKTGNEVSFQTWDRHGCWANESGHCFSGIQESPMILKARFCPLRFAHSGKRPAEEWVRHSTVASLPESLGGGSS